MKTNELTLPIMILVGLFGVLAVLLELQNIYGGNWASISGNIAPIVVFLVFFAIILVAIVRYLHG